MAEKRRLLIVEEEEAGCAGFCSRVSCYLCAGACRSVYFIFRKMFGCLRVFVDQTDDTVFPANRKRVVLGNYSQYDDQLHLVERGEVGSVSLVESSPPTKFWSITRGASVETAGETGGESSDSSDVVNEEHLPGAAGVRAGNLSCLERFLCCCGAKVQDEKDIEIELADIKNPGGPYSAGGAVVRPIIKEKHC